MKTPIVPDEIIRMEFWIDVQCLNVKQARDIVQYEKPTLAENMYILSFRAHEFTEAIKSAIKELRNK